MNIEQRIMNKIEIDDSGCWNCKGSKARGGYGRIWINGKHYYAHRLAYEVFIGEIHEGLCVCHSCDNPACVNPAHLFLGTHAENSQDMVNKDRQAKGTRQHLSRLNEEKVRFIRTSGLSLRALARMFNVDFTTVQEARKGKTWAHVT